MLNKLKDILNTYTYEELEIMDLYVNSNFVGISNILVDSFSIDLIEFDYKVCIKPDRSFEED